MPSTDLPYWLAFARVPGIGCRRTALLEARFPVSTVSSTLAMLELQGLARQVGPMAYARV